MDSGGFAPRPPRVGGAPARRARKKTGLPKKTVAKKNFFFLDAFSKTRIAPFYLFLFYGREKNRRAFYFYGNGSKRKPPLFYAGRARHTKYL